MRSIYVCGRSIRPGFWDTPIFAIRRKRGYGLEALVNPLRMDVKSSHSAQNWARYEPRKTGDSKCLFISNFDALSSIMQTAVNAGVPLWLPILFSRAEDHPIQAQNKIDSIWDTTACPPNRMLLQKSTQRALKTNGIHQMPSISFWQVLWFRRPSESKDVGKSYNFLVSRRSALRQE